MTLAARMDRQSIRMKGWDYTSPGYYFVTCNTHAGRAVFGAVVNGRMVLSEAGRVAEEEWHQSAVIREDIELDAFVVMPDHVHGIVRLRGTPEGRPAGRPSVRPSGRPTGPASGSLGAFIAGYKGATGRRINAMRGTPGAVLWHRNYWDVIVRDEKALEAIRRYIRLNPQHYDRVMRVAEPRFLGDKTLLARPKVGFLASRGANEPPQRLPLHEGEAVLSGFLSPMERAVFKAGLEENLPMIWVKPWGLEESSHSAPMRRAIDAGRLLVLSPFADTDEAPSVRRAVWCNQYVLAHSDRVVLGHLNHGGMLSCILSEANPDLEIQPL